MTVEVSGQVPKAKEVLSAQPDMREIIVTDHTLA